MLPPHAERGEPPEAVLVRNQLRTRAIAGSLALTTALWLSFITVIFMQASFGSHSSEGRAAIRASALTLVGAVGLAGAGLRVALVGFGRGNPDIPEMPPAYFARFFVLVGAVTFLLVGIPIGLYAKVGAAYRSQTSACGKLLTPKEIREFAGKDVVLEGPRDQGMFCDVRGRVEGVAVIDLEMRNDLIGFEERAERFVGRGVKPSDIPALGAEAKRFDASNGTLIAWRRGRGLAYVFLYRTRFSDPALVERVIARLASRDAVLDDFGAAAR